MSYSYFAATVEFCRKADCVGNSCERYVMQVDNENNLLTLLHTKYSMAFKQRIHIYASVDFIVKSLAIFDRTS